MPQNLNVLFLAAEAEPFIKVGGLGDVAGSLPRYLRALPPEITGGIAPDVRLVMPMYSVIKSDRRGLRPLIVFSVSHRSEPIAVQAFVTEVEGMPVYLLAADPITRSGTVYSSDPAQDGEKFMLFSLAALELTRRLHWRVNVVHANDWHTAMASYAILIRRREGDFSGVATVLTLHNLPFMGPDVSSLLHSYELPQVQTGLPLWASTRPLALGLWAADAIVAVSPSYAREIQTADLGCGLEDYLRARRESLHGILNGIDTDSWNPALDPAIGSNFGPPTLDRRALNKSTLQIRLGLPANPDVPLMGVVSRLEPQKGIDLLAPALRRLRDLDWQLVVLGTGMPRLEHAVKRLEQEFQDRVRAQIKYDSGLARQIYAGADILLMPSRYEPCGLSQMIAMRYGCLPVVTAVGGLRDTVIDGETGFVARVPTATRLASAAKRAMRLLPDKVQWTTMQRAAMARDFSWGAAARQYYDLYQRLVSQATPDPDLVS
jgi:starch synthase